MGLANALNFYTALRDAKLKPDTMESILRVSSMIATEKMALSNLSRGEVREGKRIDWQNLKLFVPKFYNSDYAGIPSGELSNYPLQMWDIYSN